MIEKKIEEIFAFCHNKHHNKWIELQKVINIYSSLGPQDKFDFSTPTGKKQFEIILNRYVGIKLLGVKLQKEDKMKENKYRFIAGNPLCPVCKIPMDIHVTMSGDRYVCDNYAYCGGSLPMKSKKSTVEKPAAPTAPASQESSE